MELQDYWESLPIGKEEAAAYPELMAKWGMGERAVRATLHALSAYDAGDGLVLIRSARNKGFYRTADPEEMKAYRKECLAKGRSIFAPVRKINRILGPELDPAQGTIFED